MLAFQSNKPEAQRETADFSAEQPTFQAKKSLLFWAKINFSS
jgi:hypothetical protein